jgi:polyphenol oxidase
VKPGSPAWPPVADAAPWRDGQVKAFTTGRRDAEQDLNFGLRCGADPQAALALRRRVAAELGCEIQWLHQVHGSEVLHITEGTQSDFEPVADAAVVRSGRVALAIQTADCLPIMLRSIDGNVVGAAHAGWRGLLAGVIENTVAAMRQGEAHLGLQAWIGPAIGQAWFEVGHEVREAFVNQNAEWGAAFLPGHRAGKWHCDLAGIARSRLLACGVHEVSVSEHCTATLEQQYFSFRRDHDAAGQAGRMLSLIMRG